jgi:pyrroline-5-carboxylate reductase
MVTGFKGKLLLVGAGNLGGALLRGWIDSGIEPGQIVVQDPSPPPHMVDLMQAHNVNCVAGALDHNHEDFSAVVLAVKPQIMDAVLPGVKPFAGASTVFLSVAAGKTIAYFQTGLGKDTALVRTIPNTPAAIGRGITAAYANSRVSPEQKLQCDQLLDAIGEVVWVDDEELIDVATGVSGSGPAYVFYLAECLAQAGVAAGLSEDIALKLARATLCGAGELMHQSPLEPGELRQNVTSPNGTTAAALEVLRDSGELADLMTRAVAAAVKRSRELAK